MPGDVKRVLVTGASRPFSPLTRRAARMVGVTLAENALGLVTGNATGVDDWVASAYLSTWADLRSSCPAPFEQLALGYFERGSLWPLRSFPSPPECCTRVASFDAWIGRALQSDAAVMVGGERGALSIARRFMDRGKPVFPIPFTGGQSGFVFQEILKTWETNPVRGLTRTQFLRLAEPWIGGTGPLSNLLKGALTARPEVFVSYRREDAASAAGRLYEDLVEHFGTSRVFMDVEGIAPSQDWRQTLEKVLDACRVGVVVIGPRWIRQLPSPGGPARQWDEDFVFWEVGQLLRLGKAVAPILVDGASLPDESQLPETLRSLLAFQAPMPLSNANWAAVVRQLLLQIEKALSSQATLDA